MQKKREAIAMTRLNIYLSEELGRMDLYSEKVICNKIDTVRKGDVCYLSEERGDRLRIH